MQLAAESAEGPDIRPTDFRVVLVDVPDLPCYHSGGIRGNSDVGSAQDGWSEKGTGDRLVCAVASPGFVKRVLMMIRITCRH